MALKTLMLRKKIDNAQKALDALRSKDTEFETRQAELEKAITEAETKEEEDAVDEAIKTFNEDKEAHNGAVKEAEETVAKLEEELKGEEEKQDTTPEPVAEEPKVEEEPAQRKEAINMSKRNIFSKMSEMERRSIFEQEDVKNWLGEYRTAMKEKRAITNVGLTIPEVMLGLLRENIDEYSKLAKYTNLKYVGGTARMLVTSGISEAYWTECCANLNEMSMAFTDVELDCYKVSSYASVCNANLEDSDIDLASEILTAIGRGIGYALDKAILYGGNSYTVGETTITNSKMPLGVVTRLAQTSQPSGYSSTERAWADLHSSNIVTITTANSTGLKLFQSILTAAANASSKFAYNGKTWVMNENTYTTLQVQAMSINAAGAIVSGMGDTMPVIGGNVVIEDFIPDNVIIMGYFDNYLLAERAGKKFAESQHVRFLADQTVFKGTARYDGKPVIAEAFVAIGINNVTPAASSVTFVQDSAN